AQQIAVRTTYGSSETAGGCVYDRRCLPGVQLHLEAPDADGAGRLVISSPTLATGYLTAEGHAETIPVTAPARDRPLPARGGSAAASRAETPLRSFITSDLASLDADGALTVLGRADDVINTGGRKVLPQDVERAIGRSLMLRGMVRSAVVVGVADPEWG